MLARVAPATHGGNPVGDKSPKSKERGQKQKSVATAKDAAAAKEKQGAYSHAAQVAGKIVPKGKK